MWGAGPLTVKRGLLGAAGVPAYQFDGAVVGSARGSAWLCHWVQQLLQLLPSCARQLQTFVTVVLQEGGRKGALVPTKASSGRHVPMSRGSRAHGERDELLLTGSITFLYFRLRFMSSPREDQRAER